MVSPADIPERQRRHALELLTVSAIGLVPWTLLLALTLPTDYQVHAWRATWVGFDVLLVVAMACTAFFGWRRRPRVLVVSALATGVLLICDAWFDVSLAIGTSDIWLSSASAVFVELPMAAFLIHRTYSLLPAAAAASHAEAEAERTAVAPAQGAGTEPADDLVGKAPDHRRPSSGHGPRLNMHRRPEH